MPAQSFDTDKYGISSLDIPREIRIHRTTEDINGLFPLYDLLELQTTAGSINAIISPQPGNKTAVLRIKSQSGDLYVHFLRRAFDSCGQRLEGEEHIKSPAERTYDTSIETTTNHIMGEIMQGGGLDGGGRTSISATTGMVDIRVFPVSDAMPSSLNTSTTTGIHMIDVKPPLCGDQPTLANLSATHRSKSSGILDLTYPLEWEGWAHVRGEKAPLFLRLAGEGRDTFLIHRAGRASYIARTRDSNKLKGVDIIAEGTGRAMFRAG